MRDLTVSEVLRKIKQYEYENGFKPRCIELDDAAQHQNLIAEVQDLIQTGSNSSEDTLTIAGVKVLLMSQILTID